MEIATPKLPTLRNAVAWTIAQQVLAFAWASFIDLNVFITSQITLHAMAAYWIWFWVFVWRRRATPTLSMLRHVKWGFISVWFISFFLSQLVWTIRKW